MTFTKYRGLVTTCKGGRKAVHLSPLSLNKQFICCQQVHKDATSTLHTSDQLLHSLLRGPSRTPLERAVGTSDEFRRESDLTDNSS